MRFEQLRSLRHKQSHGWLACAGFCDAADSCDFDTRYRAGNTGSRRSGEEQLVILAAVEGLIEGCCRMDGYQDRFHLGGHAGFRAEMCQVSREAVAQVKRG